MAAPAPTAYNKAVSKQLKENYELNKALAAANQADPLAAQAGFGMTNAAVQTIKSPVDHVEGIAEGVQEGDWVKAGLNTVGLGMDLAPIAVGLKGMVGLSSQSKLWLSSATALGEDAATLKKFCQSKFKKGVV